jgi:hypothetical protein
VQGRAIAQAVRRWLPTAAARVRVWAACGICGRQSGIEGGFLRALRFSLANHSTNFFIIIIIITRGWHNISCRSAEWTQLNSTPHYTNVKKNKRNTKLSLLERSSTDHAMSLNTTCAAWTPEVISSSEKRHLVMQTSFP